MQEAFSRVCTCKFGEGYGAYVWRMKETAEGSRLCIVAKVTDAEGNKLD